MKRYFLVVILLVCELVSFAQLNDTWMDYLKELKSEFIAKDKICIKYDRNDREVSQTSISVKSNDCQILFKDSKESNFCDSLRMDYYSYFLSDSNYATLTFLMRSPHILVLFNYSPIGELLQRIEVFGDGESAMFDSTSSYFISDSTFIVTKKLGKYERIRRKVLYSVSTSECKYSVSKSGKIVRETCKNSIKTKDAPKSYKIFIAD